MQHSHPGKKPVKVITEPYLSGSMTDATTFKSALAFFGGQVALMLFYLFIGSMMVMDSQVFTIVVNVLLVAVAWYACYQRGAVNGTEGVYKGEILHQRRERGHEVTAADTARCYHPLKGLISALLGTSPIFLCACALALTTQEVVPGAANEVLTVTDFLRMVVRMALLPLIHFAGLNSTAAHLVLEQLSPLLVLLPAGMYALGYSRGPAIRTRIHTDIYLGKRRQLKKQKRENAQRSHRGPDAPR